MMINLLFSTLVSLYAATAPLFPVDYEESRARFRDGCAESQALGPGFCRGYGVPSRAYGDLSVDVAYFTRGGSRLLVLESGTHGPEAYAGSAIQELARRHHLERLLSRGIDVLFIHALNPFGFKAGRRADEDNVNLNRNFIISGESYDSINDGYRKMRSTFEPEGKVGGVLSSYVSTDANLLSRLVGAGFSVRKVSEAMNGGQYEFDRGINYGGRGPSPQVQIIRELLTPLLASHRKTIFIDWHTGLGENGTLHLMTGATSTPALVGELKSTFAALTEDKIITTIAAEARGFFSTTGGVESFVPTLAPKASSVIGITAEFGTMGVGIPAQLRSAHRIIVENQAWNFGCADALICSTVRADFVAMFNPPDRQWRDGVLLQAGHFLNAIERSFK